MYPIVKRTLDILAAVICLVFLAPVLLGVAMTVRLRLGAPVFFRHARPGLHEETLYCLKFRTMTEARGESGELLSDRERLTPFGCLLRRYSLDELPQLWNVLRGEMSLVGPRPLEMRYLPLYTAEQRRRHLVKPGITGWAQINGRNAITWEQKFALDLWYVDHCSVRLDLKILLLTAWKVLRAEGISQAGHATMPDFLGTPQS